MIRSLLEDLELADDRKLFRFALDDVDDAEDRKYEEDQTDAIFNEAVESSRESIVGDNAGIDEEEDPPCEIKDQGRSRCG